MDTQSPDHTRSALILYGSETGNAQEVAEELGALAERLRFATHVSELNHSEPVSAVRLRVRQDRWLTIRDRQETLFSYTLTIFVVSTTGQGDLPANARGFWKALLLKKLPPTYLNGVNFVIFGLGDSSYPKYVHAAYLECLDIGRCSCSTGSIGQHGSFTNDYCSWVQMMSIQWAKLINNILRG